MISNILIGIDFSINKTGATVFSDNKYYFFGWPYNLQKRLPDLYKSAGVKIIDRLDTKDKGDNISSKMRYEVKNASFISNLILNTLKPYLNENTYIGYEGISYGSSGDVVLQLGGYKFILMNTLSKLVPLKNMFTYSPITIKKTAGCSKRGLGKHAMIESFISSAKENSLKSALINDKESFMKKGGINFVDHLDDLIDSYFVLETLRNKENI